MAMRFTMDGHAYELTQESVRACLTGQTPGEIRQYWVEIDGVRWPVKQVLRLATGSSEFQSQTAQRHLRTLRFVVGSDVAAREHTVKAPVARRQFDLDALAVVEHVDARVAFSWHQAGSVVLDAGGTPEFPDLPHSPGLYRFDFGVDSEGSQTLYIGESEDLRKRASQYRNAKKDGGANRTSRRIHKDVVAHLLAGRGLSFAVTTAVRIEGDVVADLRRKSARRLAENAAVLRAQMSPNFRVLNIDADLEGADAVAHEVGRQFDPP